MAAYPIDNAIFQWEEGERRVRAHHDPERRQLEAAATTIVDELRRRLGSTFTLSELAELYAAGTDWAADLAGGGTESAAVVAAAFARYARGASDYSGSHPGWR